MAGEGDGPFSEVPWFSDEELSRLSEFLTGDSARDQRSFQTLLSTVTEVLGESDFDRLLHKLVDYVIQTTRSERGILLLDETGRLRVRVARDKQGRDLGDNPPLARTVCEMIEEAVRIFETRLLPHSVRVELVPSRTADDFKLHFRIDGILQVEPITEPVSFDTDILVDTHAVEVKRSG